MGGCLSDYSHAPCIPRRIDYNAQDNNMGIKKPLGVAFSVKD